MLSMLYAYSGACVVIRLTLSFAGASRFTSSIASRRPSM